jgi:hypothetical protein
MGKRTTFANRTFMLGSFVMMVLLILIVFAFLMWAFKINKNQTERKYSDRYEITLGTTTFGKPMNLYVNDSLLFSGTPSSEMTLTFTRFAEENSLLIVDTQSDQVSLISLPEKQGKIRIEKEGVEFKAAP